MKLPIDPRLPQNDAVPALKQRLIALFRDIAVQVNALSEGSIAARYAAQTAAPTTGTYQQGDFIANKTPTEQGTAGSKYIIDGWKCVASGAPGTWVQCRYLTGN